MKKLFNLSLVMLAAAALVTTTLVTNCVSPLDGTAAVGGGGGSNPRTFQPPAGMGYIRVNLTNNARATLIPTLPGIDTLDYRIAVKDKTSSPAPDDIVWDSDDADKGNGSPIFYDDLADYPVTLLPGTSRYKVVVTAYNPGTTEVVGLKEVDNVSVAAGGGSSVDVYLEPFIAGDDGTFVYNIGLPSNIGDATGTFSAVLDVKTYPGRNYTGVPLALQGHALTGAGNNTNSPAGISIPAGIYLVTVAMSDPGDSVTPKPPALQSSTATTMVYIYQNITTSYAPALDALNVFSYEVTYDTNGGNTLSQTTFGPFAHGSTLTKTSDAPTDPTHPTSGYTFNSWHRSTTTTNSTAWVWGTSRLIGPMTLYAIWDSTVKVGLSIVMDWGTPGASPALDKSDFQFTQAKFYSGDSQTVTVSFADLDGFTIDIWGNPDGSQRGPTGAASMTIDSSDPADIGFLVGGKHTFSVIVYKGTYGDPDYIARELDFILETIP